MIFQGREIAETLVALGVSDVVWLPDSALGPWEEELERSPELRLIRVCREGEIWATCAGIYLGGGSPLAMLQTTGLFDSGDALRNVLYDLQIPIFAVIGARSWLVEGSRDSARRFALPVLDAWEIDYVLIENTAEKERLAEHYRACRAAGRPGAVLIAEGRL